MKFPDIVIVTGAGQGLGKQVALELAKEKVKVLCISKTSNCYSTAEQINKEGGNAQPMQIDFINLYYTKKSIQQWCERYPDNTFGVVLNAGVLGKPGGILDSRMEDWEETIHVNLLGNMAVLQGVLPSMIKKQFGRVIALAGGGAAYAFPTFSGYALSKVAIVREVENIAEELKDKIKDFCILALAPGAMKTEMLKKVLEAGAEVRTTVEMEEPVNFIRDFMQDDFKNTEWLSGRFMHVRDNFSTEDYKDKWKLRRLE
jgi:3-oxoacyl-[acyl-carrier protein] reductase